MRRSIIENIRWHTNLDQARTVAGCTIVKLMLGNLTQLGEDLLQMHETVSGEDILIGFGALMNNNELMNLQGARCFNGAEFLGNTLLLLHICSELEIASYELIYRKTIWEVDAAMLSGYLEDSLNISDASTSASRLNTTFFSSGTAKKSEIGTREILNYFS